MYNYELLACNFCCERQISNRPLEPVNSGLSVSRKVVHFFREYFKSDLTGSIWFSTGITGNFGKWKTPKDSFVVTGQEAEFVYALCYHEPSSYLAKPWYENRKKDNCQCLVVLCIHFVQVCNVISVKRYFWRPRLQIVPRFLGYAEMKVLKDLLWNQERKTGVVKGSARCQNITILSIVLMFTCGNY